MEIISLIGIAIIATLLALLIRRDRPELALLLALTAAALIFLFAVTRLAGVISVLEGLAQRTGINRQYFSLLLKIIAIAYIAEFGAQVCRDAGQEAVAGAVEVAGKILVLVLSVPILIAVFDLTLKLLP
ncbi:stage III sporulation protein AD [Gelria sp. Kuro-4]|uniref:stage III sporulation protein AD n=1 Tax=Gelria sp. Kuro-4 TaxID=2796927 RepID=UPI001BEDE30F|nr:stage III sporulation protein AD [Gelria sp. Kuro-4]BCV25129.1 stage III sporulation protein AD [Gelria sp. Kuro-4]